MTVPPGPPPPPIQSFPAERAVPFYCPYCGEEDLEPQDLRDRRRRCRSCIRSFAATLCGNRSHPVSRDATRPTRPAPPRERSTADPTPARLEELARMESLAEGGG